MSYDNFGSQDHAGNYQHTQQGVTQQPRLDLGDLMVKSATPAKLISAKPVELFRQAKRPEITRLADLEPMAHLRKISHWGVVPENMADPLSPPYKST